MNEKPDELKIFITRGETKCGECKEDLGRHAWVFLAGEKGALCLACADLDHLVFLASGSAALTLRAKKYSRVYAVVLEWSRTRKQYERQGLLVEEEALQKAEQECIADEEARERRREREAEKRAELDQAYVEKFTKRVRELYPKCPKGREKIIAEHACRKFSGRVGRSAAAKQLDEAAVRLAVEAHVRHHETKYDELLFKGYDRYDARSEVKADVWRIMDKWAG